MAMLVKFGLAICGLYGLGKMMEGEAPTKKMPPREAGSTLTACSFCGKSCIRRCSRCKAVSYCSDVCQYEHWRLGHEYECVETKNDSAALKFKLQAEAPLQELCDAIEGAENDTSQADIAENECAKLEKEVKEYKKLVERLKRQLKHYESQIGKIKFEEISQEISHELLLVNALDYAENAKSRADFAEIECARMKIEHRELQKLVERLELESQNAGRKVEEKSLELVNALSNVEKATSRAEIAKDKCANQKRHLKEQGKLIQKLKLEQSEVKREVKEMSHNLATALNDLSNAEEKVGDLEEEIKSSDDFKICAICLTNEKGIAFTCGHMTCQDCDKKISSVCPICRKQIHRRMKLFFG